MTVLAALAARAAAAFVLLPAAARAQQPDDADTTFLSGPELAARLLPGLVHVMADDLGEQGFGVVVGADAGSVYVLTARHVVSRRPPEGLAGAEQPSREPRLAFCATPDSPPVAAAFVPGFDAGTSDVALLRAPRPSGYAPPRRALAPVQRAVPGSDTWVLGFEERCEAGVESGRLESAADERGLLQARQRGVRGGSSGGPLMIGQGLVGLVTDSDQIVVRALELAALAPRVRAAGGAWELDDARNVPPTDPLAAQIDLSETLNRYLFAVRNAQALLLQPYVVRASFAEQVERYNRAIRRFSDAREKYDGTLARQWPPEVLPQWQRLRDELWRVHLNFWQVNTAAAEIVKNQRSPPQVVERMRALDPALDGLQGSIEHFLRDLGDRRIGDAGKP